MSYQILPGTPETAEEVHRCLQTYNAQYLTDFDEFTFCVRDASGALLGGIAATRELDCVTIDYLYVEERARKNGLGQALLARAEAEGRRQGARRVILNTFSFQAPEFYEKQGYQSFGAVEPCLGGYGQYFYRKDL